MTEQPPHPSARSAELAAILKSGLRDNRRSPLWWGGGLGSLCALVLFIWPSIEDSVGELIDSYPEGLKQAFGIGELDTVEAYLDAEMLSLIVPLAVSFLAVRTICRGTTTPEERGWLDTLLATPLSRGVLLAGSFTVAAAVVAITLLVVLALTMAAGLLSGTDPSFAVVGRGLANVWPLALFFAGVAAIAAGATGGSARVTGSATGILVAMYLVDLLGRVSDDLETARWASAFRYYGSATSDGIDPLHFTGLTVAGLLLTVAGVVLLRRRDLGA